MANNGTNSVNLTATQKLDEIIGNASGSTRRQKVEQFAAQLASTRPLSLLGLQAPLFAVVDDLEASSTTATSAWVYADGPASGIYSKVAGVWTWALPLPYSFIEAENTGAGTANAIIATTRIPVTDGPLVILPIVATTTGPATVSFNGADPVTIKTATGNDLPDGALVGGMRVMGVRSSAELRLVTEIVSDAIIAQAQIAADLALASAQQATEMAAFFDPDNYALKGELATYYTRSEIDAQQIAQNTDINDLKSWSETATDGLARTVPYMFFGLAPENINNNVERFANGGMTLNGGYIPTDVHPLINPAGWQDVNLTIVGAGGRDWTTLSAANGLTVYFYFLIHSTDSTLNSVIASLSLSNGGVNIPSGYSAVMQIPHAKIYHPTLGLMPHHLKGGRPWSIHLTGYDTDTYYVLPGTYGVVGTGAYVDINCSSLVPNPCRLARFRYKITGTSGPGSLFVSAPGVADNKEVGYVASGGVATGEFEVRLSSTGVFQVKWPSANTLNFLSLVEYTNSEYT